MASTSGSSWPSSRRVEGTAKRVGTLSLKSVPGTVLLGSLLEFDDRMNIGTFITLEPRQTGMRNAPHVATGHLWETIAEDKWRQSVKGISAIPEMDKADLIDNEKEFVQHKMDEFFCFLASSKYFSSCGPGKMCPKPDIVLSDGRLVDFMKTLVSKGRPWRVYAIRCKGTIFIANLDDREDSPSYQVEVEQYANTCLQWRLRGQNCYANIVTEWLKAFSVSHVRFGVHQILLLSEYDGLVETDGKKEHMKARTIKEASSFAGEYGQRQRSLKYFRWWGQCISSDIKKFAVCPLLEIGQGQLTKSYIIQDLEVLKPADLWTRTGLSEKTRAVSLAFLDKVLTWIKDTMSNANENKVFVFQWEGNKENLADFVEEDIFDGIEEEEISSLGVAQQILEETVRSNRDEDKGKRKAKGREKPEEFLVCDVITDKKRVSEIRGELLPPWFVNAAMENNSSLDPW